MTGKLLRLWQKVNLWSYTGEGELIWWSSDDVHLRKRKLDFEIRMPKIIWRWYCSWKGKHEDYYGECIYCGKGLS